MRTDTNLPKKKRGRPRAYNEAQALNAALRVFLRRGFSATSLDEISLATHMNRPSLYSAFGNKKSMYRKAISAFNKTFFIRLQNALFAGESLEKDLKKFYAVALSEYQGDSGNALGCPTLCTAVIEAPTDDEIRSDLAAAIERVEQMLEERFEQAVKDGQLELHRTKSLARIAAALLHSLALRARAGLIRGKRSSFIDDAVMKILIS